MKSLRSRSGRRIQAAPRFALALGLLTLAMPPPAARAQMFDDFALPTGQTAPGNAVPPWVIADFDAGPPALKDGTHFVPAKGSRVEVASEGKIRYQGKGQSMKVSYDLAAEPKADTALSADLKGLDASKRHALSFFVFGSTAGSPAELEVVLKTADGEGRTRIKGISPYFWAREVVSFAQLGIKDAAKVLSLTIVVPKDAKPAKGSFYIDQIAFE